MTVAGNYWNWLLMQSSACCEYKYVCVCLSSLGQKGRWTIFLFFLFFFNSKQEFFIGPLVHAATAVLYVNAIKADNIQPFYSPSDTPLATSLVSEGVVTK